MKDFKDATVPEKLDRMIGFLEKWNKNITIVPEDKKYLIEIKGLIEKQQKEIEEVKAEKEKYEAIVKRALMYLDYIDDDTLKMCTRYDVNGIDILKILKGD